MREGDHFYLYERGGAWPTARGLGLLGEGNKHLICEREFNSGTYYLSSGGGKAVECTNVISMRLMRSSICIGTSARARTTTSITA